MTGSGISGERPVNVAQAPFSDREAARHSPGFTHAALFYRGDGDDLGELGSLLPSAAGPDAPLHVAVPDQNMELIDAFCRPPLGGSRLVDMAELGRNPARIISAGQSFGDRHRGQHVYCVWEPAWPTRSAAELREVARHEALCNLAFGGRPMTIFCLYDTKRLSDAVIANAEQTHPALISAGELDANPSYLGAGRFPPGCDEPLPPPAVEATSLIFDGQLGPVREFSADRGRAAGLDGGRLTDFVLAVSEIAANALGHAGNGGTVRSWCTSTEIVCQVEDRGYIADPLAGRYRNPADSQGGHGLWLVNRVCDLVERRSSPGGTVTRLHMRRPA
ncbi:MAG: sensor histidine kinase [Nocardiopsaceae bacterium]|jgi:anti-sigma regulatory factor (Ser/Thr protein kinase)|nr:sensor histidine kinase [Nocardiopsaceae bacterium]